MRSNPSARKIQYKLAQIRQLEKECINILIESPTCFEDKSQKGEMVERAMAHIESKLNRAIPTNPSYANAKTIYLSLALQEFEEVSDDPSKKQAAKKVTLKLLELTESDLKLIPGEIKEAAYRIASMYLVEL